MSEPDQQQATPTLYWHEISFTLPSTAIPLAEQALENLNALSVTLKDAGNQPLLEPQPDEQPLWDHSILTALFSQHDDAPSILVKLKETLGQAKCSEFQLNILKNRQWERICLDQLKPLKFGRNLWIYPSHITPPDDQSTTITLDPGLAFGTGTHPTTAMCLQWLDNNPPKQKTVIDYGCGSGLLSIAAAKLGADHIYASDIDPQALIASQQNAKNNNVLAQLNICKPELMKNQQADLVLANILSSILIKLSNQISNLVTPGGQLVLSGILQDQASEVCEAYSPKFEFNQSVFAEEWVLLEGKKLF